MKHLPSVGTTSMPIMSLKWIAITLIFHTSFLVLIAEARVLKNRHTSSTSFLDNYDDDDTTSLDNFDFNEIKETKPNSEPADFPSISIQINGGKSKSRKTKPKNPDTEELSKLEKELLVNMKKIQDYFSQFKSSDRNIWNRGGVQCPEGEKFHRKLKACLPVRRSSSSNLTGPRTSQPPTHNHKIRHKKY